MSSSSDRPNIVFVLTDDQGYWAMGCAGNNEIRTPNLDRLAASGTRFTNFFCTSPVCSAARASILTGRIPSQHGVHDWLRAGNSTIENQGKGQLIEYLEGQTGYTDCLARNGYTCGLSGKWHLGDAHHPQKGLSFWRVHATGGAHYYQAPMIVDGEVRRDERYVSDLITDNAIEFIDQQSGRDDPFYIGVHYTAPHSPWHRDDHPKDIYDAYHADCPFESVPNTPRHPWDIPRSYPKSEGQRRDCLSGYFTAVTAMDTGVGRLLDHLEEKGLREQTLVLFCSDNGMNMGHHGIYGKGNGTFPLNMFDTSVKVPMLMSRPGYVAEGAVCDELLCQVDLMPTLLAATGTDDPEQAGRPGQSFAPLLRGEPGTGRDNVVVHDEYGPVRMIRSRDWKYVHRYPYGPHELYDLVNDPDEESNLVDRPEQQDRIARMHGEMEEWFLRWVDPELDGTHEAVTGRGQVGLAGRRANGKKRFAE